MSLTDWPPAILRMGQLAIQRRDPAWVRRDPVSGGWRHNYLRGGVMVTPQPRKGSWRVFDELTRDIFFYDYTPKAGDVVVELGAGCGTETVTLSPLVAPGGVIIACEAHPWTASLLRRTMAENELKNVQVVQAAITGNPGLVNITDKDAGRNIGNTLTAAGSGIEVPAFTLDDLVAQHDLDRIDFLKVNIESAEGPMLAGMEQSISMIRHAAISCHDFGAPIIGDDTWRTREQVRAFFESHGFSIKQRPNDPRYWVRDYLYAKRTV